MNPSADDGFEGLIARLLAGEIGAPFLVAGGGFQGGLDLASEVGWACAVAVECKRFGTSNPISERDLEAEIAIAHRTKPDLDLWILATTRGVTTQEDAALARACGERGIDYLSLACGTKSDAGTLDALCSRHATLLVEFLVARLGASSHHVTEARAHAAGLLADPKAERHLQNIRDRLRRDSVGFWVFRSRINVALKEALGDQASSRLRFGQPLHVGDAAQQAHCVHRSSVHAALTAFLNQSAQSIAPPILVVEGREGDGKTWATADWILQLLAAPDAPAVFFVGAQDSVPRDPLDLLTGHANVHAPISASEAYRTKLERWALRGGPRKFVVLLDGINERHDPGLWTDVIQGLAGKLGSSALVLVTCRSETWKTSYENRIWMKSQRVTVGPFDDAEFARGTEHLRLAERQRLVELGPLVRRPRYFACAVRHLAALSSSDDLTIARLYYEDWRERLRQQPGLVLDVDEFEDLLRQHAQAWLENHDASQSKSFAALPLDATTRQVIEELSTGGVLRKEPGGKLRAEPQYLALGLGLLLADTVSTFPGDIASKVQRAEEQLGDTDDWDLTADICEQAVLHALRTPQTYDRMTTVALLMAWTRCQNAVQRAVDCLPSYGDVRPDVIVELAEQLWRRPDTHSQVERAVLDGLIRIAKLPGSASLLIPTFDRWLGFVHEHGESSIPDALGASSVPPFEVARLLPERQGSRDFLGVQVRLTRLEEQRPLRLGRLALAVISGADRRSFWRPLVTGQIANEAMGGCRSGLIGWVIRSSPQVLTDLASETIRRFRADGDIVCLRAARRLVQYLGDPGLSPELDTLPPSLFPTNPLREEFNKDPCLSMFFAPTLEQLPECLKRQDVPGHLKLGRAAQLAADMTFPFPREFIEAVEKSAIGFPMGRLCLQMSVDQEDLTWEHLEPLLCRFNPALHQQKIREFAGGVSTRDGLALRQLALTIHRYSLLLSPAESGAMRQRWEQLVTAPPPWDSEQSVVEAFIFLALLPTLPPDEQLDCLMRRPYGAYEMVRMTPLFAAWPDGSAEVLARRGAESDQACQKILWLMTAQESLVEAICRPVVAQGLRSTESATRGLAMAVLNRMSKAVQRDLFLPLTWSFTPDMSGMERYYGSAFVASLSTEDAEHAVRRCDMQLLGEIVGRLSPDRAAEVARAYGEALLSTARTLVDAGISVSPHPTVEVSGGSVSAPWIQYGPKLDDRSTETFRAELSTWGGLDSMPEVGGIFRRLDDDVREAEKIALRETFKKALADGNWLLALYISNESANAILNAVPDFIDRLKAVARLAEVRERVNLLTSLLDSFACALLRRGHAAAWDLLELVESFPNSVQHTDYLTGLLRRDAALLSSPVSQRSETQWRERLRVTRTDREFLTLLYGLAIGGNREWLLRLAAEDAQVASPYHRARALAILAVADDDGFAFDQTAGVYKGDGTWYEDLTKWLQSYRARGQAMCHWLDRLLSPCTPADRCAAAHLFQHCADMRGRHLIESRRQACQNVEDFDIGIRWLDTDKLRKASNSVDKQLDERLMGQKTLRHDAVPWLDD